MGNVPWAEPEQHGRVESVNVRNQEWWCHDEKQNVTQTEVRCEVTELGNLAKEFTAGLCHRVPTHVVPFTGPPGNVGAVSPELTSQSESNDELVDETLDGHRGNHAGKTSGEIPALEEPHDLEKNDEHDDCNSVGNTSQHGTELLAAHAEERTHAACETEEHAGNTGVDTNGNERDDCDADEGVRKFHSLRDVFVLLFGDTGLGVDVQVWDKRDSDQEEGSNDLSKEDVAKAGTGGVT